MNLELLGRRARGGTRGFLRVATLSSDLAAVAELDGEDLRDGLRARRVTAFVGTCPRCSAHAFVAGTRAWIAHGEDCPAVSPEVLWLEGRSS